MVRLKFKVMPMVVVVVELVVEVSVEVGIKVEVNLTRVVVEFRAV